MTEAAKRKPKLGSSQIVAAGTLASRALGLVRDVVLAAVFRRDETDAFFVAFTIPNVLRQILGEGAASSAVQPALSKTLAREGDDATRALFQRIRGASVVVLFLVTLAGVLLARPLTDLFAAGYHDRPGMFERTVALTRNVFPYLLLTGIAAIGSAALHAKRKYSVVAFAPALLNVAFVATAFALPAALDERGFDRAQAIVAGALLGGALQIAIQFPVLRRAGFTGPAIVDFRDPAIGAIARRIAPIGLGVVVYAIDLILSRRFLSDFGPGAQSWFSWAMRLCDFPQQVFAVAVSTMAATSFSRLFARTKSELPKAAATKVRLTLFFTLPASVALVLLAEPIVTLVFQRGEFDATDSWETSRALMWQASALWAMATSRQLVSLLYAIGSTRFPLVASAIDLVVFIALALGLRGRIGHVAISVAVAGSGVAQMILVLGWARYKLPSLDLLGIFASTARTLAAALLAGVAGWSSTQALVPASHATGIALMLPGLAALVAFTAMYLLASWSMRSPELAALVRAVRGARLNAR